MAPLALASAQQTPAAMRGTAATGPGPASPAALPQHTPTRNRRSAHAASLSPGDVPERRFIAAQHAQHAGRTARRCGRPCVLPTAAHASAVLACCGWGGRGVAPGRAAPEHADGMELTARTLDGGSYGPCAAGRGRLAEDIPPGVICWGPPRSSATTLARRSSHRAADSSRCVIDASR